MLTTEPRPEKGPANWDVFKYPGLWAPLVIFALTIFVPVAVTLFLISLGVFKPDFGSAGLGLAHSWLDFAIGGAVFLLMAIPSVWLIASASRIRFSEVLRSAAVVARSDWRLILWVFVATFVAGTFLDRILVPLGLDATELTQSILARPLFAVLAVTVGPVAEELWGRGLVYGALRRWGVWPAILGSTLLTAAIHLNWVQFIGTLPGMLGLGWLRHKTGRVGPGIILHVGWNVLALGLGLLAVGL